MAAENTRVFGTFLAVMALLATAYALPTAAVSKCRTTYEASLAAASTNEGKCTALFAFARCLADVTQDLPAADRLQADNMLVEVQIALGENVTCTDFAPNTPNRMVHKDGSLNIEVNEDSDTKFFRFRRESVSIWDLQAQYDAIVEEVRTSLQDILNNNEIALEAQAANSDGLVTGVRTAVDILIADVSTRATQIVDAATTSSVKADEVQTIVNSAVSSAEAARMQKQTFDLDEMRAALAADMSRNFATIQAKRDDVRARFEVGFKRLRDTIAAAKQSVVSRKVALDAQIQAELARFENAEANLNEKFAFPVITDLSLEDKNCTSANTGFVFLSKPGPAPEMPVDPAGAEDDINGQTINVPSNSHGAGYSIAMRELWNPTWDTSTVNRYDADTFTPKGNFNVGRNQIMQCAGDEQGFFYGAHWGLQLICKFGPWPTMTTERWCFNLGCTAAGVGFNSNITIGVCNSNSQIWLINRDSGQLIRTVPMQNWPGGGNYGIAFAGSRMWWLYPNQAHEYNYMDGTFRRSFALAANPNAVFTDGEKFCVSPNSDQFYCYRVNKFNIYGGGARLYWCNGEKHVRL